MRKNLFFIFIGMVITVFLTGAGLIYYQQMSSQSPLISVVKQMIHVPKKEPQDKKKAVAIPTPTVVAATPIQTNQTRNLSQQDPEQKDKKEKEKRKHSFVEGILKQWKSNNFQILVNSSYFVTALDAHYGTDDWFTYDGVIDVMYGIGINNKVIIDPMSLTPKPDPSTKPPNIDDNLTADPPVTNEPPIDLPTKEPPSTQPGTDNPSKPPTNPNPNQPSDGTDSPDADDDTNGSSNQSHSPF
ncbi:hypothetical protein [Thermoflavimicrobium daqui]|jgi:hypothetical protein|uniref:Uncharacterized protein n=1 Tax=Thermoflavimicrobium daqui TaxID=2137476 RepID=A0A364K167_9BACL|nr:hypothetical protein [Thermoflavimicrobium daqui]RAL21427.1 hypothetical protein DL897_16410 [Thermoflavimicrobium daqui]